MNAAARRELIVELLESSGKVLVSELSPRTGVSEMTIRRDLEALEQRGVLVRVHGGAVTAQSRSYEPPFAVRSMRQADAKRRIGRLAASLLTDGETAILDAGTTTMEVARALKGRRNLRILAMSLRIADELVEEPGITVMVNGGVARPGERSMIGALAERAFADLLFDTFFVTVGGIDSVQGLTEFNLDDATVKRAAVGSARRLIAVADSSKLGKIAFARVCPIAQLDVLITDDRAPREILDELRTLGVDVMVA